MMSNLTALLANDMIRPPQKSKINWQVIKFTSYYYSLIIKVTYHRLSQKTAEILEFKDITVTHRLNSAKAVNSRIFAKYQLLRNKIYGIGVCTWLVLALYRLSQIRYPLLLISYSQP
jgi:hypothetical protein